MIFNQLIKKIKAKYQILTKRTHISYDSAIGLNTYIGYNCFITKANIGNYCSIANNVSIGMGEHDLDQISTSSLFYEVSYQELTKADCSIGHDVWIGVDAIIKRGVHIGTGAIIGANTFVNADVPDYAIVVGNPGKILKYRFTENQQQKILASKWWLQDLPQAKMTLKTLLKEL